MDGDSLGNLSRRKEKALGRSLRVKKLLVPEASISHRRVPDNGKRPPNQSVLEASDMRRIRDPLRAFCHIRVY
jgi:hypothetical protein